MQAVVAETKVLEVFCNQKIRFEMRIGVIGSRLYEDFVFMHMVDFALEKVWRLMKIYLMKYIDCVKNLYWKICLLKCIFMRRA